MNSINNNKSLSVAIKELEAKKKSEKNLLLAHIEFTKEQLNPIYIIKEKINQTINSGEAKDKIITAVMGVTSGFAAKKLLLGKSINPLVGFIFSAIKNKLFSEAKKSNLLQEKGVQMALDFLKKIKID
jgi:hypothetical protein